MENNDKNTPIPQSCKTAVMSRMFFWCGLMLFDYGKKENGGFNHFIAEKIFMRKLHYLELSITYRIHFDYKKFYYDGNHTYYHFGCVRLIYGS
jgi:hypothetical protein